jgi:hypothetical protein
MHRSLFASPYWSCLLLVVSLAFLISPCTSAAQNVDELKVLPAVPDEAAPRGMMYGYGLRQHVKRLFRRSLA